MTKSLDVDKTGFFKFQVSGQIPYTQKQSPEGFL